MQQDRRLWKIDLQDSGATINPPPRPTGWGTQPLRCPIICGRGILPRCSNPRFCQYAYGAPLEHRGLDIPPSIDITLLWSDKQSRPPGDLLTYHALRITFHMSPRWGLGGRGMLPCYKHVAPLGLKTRFPVFPSSDSLCSLCLCGVFLPQRFVQSKIYVNRSLRLCRRF